MFGIVGALLLAIQAGPDLVPGTSPFFVLGSIALVTGTILLLRAVVAALRQTAR